MDKKLLDSLDILLFDVSEKVKKKEIPIEILDQFKNCCKIYREGFIEFDRLEKSYNKSKDEWKLVEETIKNAVKEFKDITGMN